MLLAEDSSIVLVPNFPRHKESRVFFSIENFEISPKFGFPGYHQ
jgi:hypothetical protein